MFVTCPDLTSRYNSDLLNVPCPPKSCDQRSYMMELQTVGSNMDVRTSNLSSQGIRPGRVRVKDMKKNLDRQRRYDRIIKIVDGQNKAKYVISLHVEVLFFRPMRNGTKRKGRLKLVAKKKQGKRLLERTNSSRRQHYSRAMRLYRSACFTQFQGRRQREARADISFVSFPLQGQSQAKYLQ